MYNMNVNIKIHTYNIIYWSGMCTSFIHRRLLHFIIVGRVAVLFKVAFDTNANKRCCASHYGTCGRAVFARRLEVC
jgi:hypothetical protein